MRWRGLSSEWPTRLLSRQPVKSEVCFPRFPPLPATAVICPSPGFIEKVKQKRDATGPAPRSQRLRRGPQFRPSLHYSQRNTFAESAVQTANMTARAATSLVCADHASPFHIPWSSDTA